MPPFKTSLCRTPGGFFTLPNFFGMDTAVSAYITGVAQFLLMGVLCAVLPAMLYWQYRRRRWWTGAAGLVAFILALDHLMLKDRGSLWHTLAATTILCGPPYLASVGFRAAMRRLGSAVSGDDPAALSWSNRAALATLTVVAHLLFFIVATIADIASPALLGVVGDAVNCLYHLARPVDFRSYGEQLNMLLAALPTLVLATLLQGWLRRRPTIGLRAPLLLSR